MVVKFQVTIYSDSYNHVSIDLYQRLPKLDGNSFQQCHVATIQQLLVQILPTIFYNFCDDLDRYYRLFFVVTIVGLTSPRTSTLGFWVSLCQYFWALEMFNLETGVKGSGCGIAFWSCLETLIVFFIQRIRGWSSIQPQSGHSRFPFFPPNKLVWQIWIFAVLTSHGVIINKAWLGLGRHWIKFLPLTFHCSGIQMLRLLILPSSPQTIVPMLLPLHQRNPRGLSQSNLKNFGHLVKVCMRWSRMLGSAVIIYLQKLAYLL